MLSPSKAVAADELGGGIDDRLEREASDAGGVARDDVFTYAYRNAYGTPRKRVCHETVLTRPGGRRLRPVPKLRTTEPRRP